MKIGTKLLLSYCLVALVASATSWFAIRSFQTVGTAFNGVKEHAVPRVEALGEIKYEGEAIINSTMEYGFIIDELAASHKEHQAKEKVTHVTHREKWDQA